MDPTSNPRRLVAPLTISGVAMAAYLLLRPYGDGDGADHVAGALASPWWLVAHVCGMVALAGYAGAALRLPALLPGSAPGLARWSALAGTALVLPYYGAETFALHVVAAHSTATGDGAVVALVDLVRDQPLAVTTFGIGLVSLAVSGVSFAVAWQRSGRGPRRWAAWPLGLLVAVLLAQFSLPVAGRMAYGVAFLAASTLLAGAAGRPRPPARAGERSPAGSGPPAVTRRASRL